MSDGYEVNTARLRDLADGIEAEADTLKSDRADPAPRPDAGRSSTEVAAALTRLLDGATDLTAIGTYIAESVRMCADNYDRVDEASADRMRSLYERW